MSKVKKIIVHIPVIGYLVRFISSLIFLPKHLTAFRFAFERDKRQLDDLESMSFRVNQKIIELQDRIDTLEKKNSLR